MKFFFELFGPIVGHLRLFQKNDNCVGGGGGGDGGMGMPGVD